MESPSLLLPWRWRGDPSPIIWTLPLPTVSGPRAPLPSAPSRLPEGSFLPQQSRKSSRSFHIPPPTSQPFCPPPFALRLAMLPSAGLLLPPLPLSWVLLSAGVCALPHTHPQSPGRRGSFSPQPHWAWGLHAGSPPHPC